MPVCGKHGQYIIARQPEYICQLVEAGRGWPRLEVALSLIYISGGAWWRANWP